MRQLKAKGGGTEVFGCKLLQKAKSSLLKRPEGSKAAIMDPMDEWDGSFLIDCTLHPFR